MSSTPLVGVAAALASSHPTRTAISQFLLIDHVAMVTGAQRGLGLEMALALAEAGAVVYCLDLPPEPNDNWIAVQKYVAALTSLDPSNANKKGRLEYMSANVTDQSEMWSRAEEIVKKEGRLDVCCANAGIFGIADCLECSANDFEKIIGVNLNGVYYTAQAAGRQMARLGIKGSIILTASMSGSITNQNIPCAAYNASKSGVLQLARSMACELGSKGIRVNSISPGYMLTEMTKQSLDPKPHLRAEWSSQNPLGRLGEPHELRGVVLWLASSASTFCTGSDIIVDGGHRAW